MCVVPDIVLIGIYSTLTYQPPFLEIKEPTRTKVIPGDGDSNIRTALLLDTIARHTNQLFNEILTRKVKVRLSTWH